MAAVQGTVGVQDQAKTAQNVAAGMDRQGGLMVSELNPKYLALSLAGRIFSAMAIVTAPVIFSTAAGTGGPLLWNPPNSGVNATLIGLGLGASVVSTVAGSLGITGNSGQQVAPTTTTAIDASGPSLVGGAPSKIFSFRLGTPALAGNQFIPFAQVHTGPLTVDNLGLTWTDLWGFFTLGPGSWVSLAGSATLTTMVANMALVWVENPV